MQAPLRAGPAQLVLRTVLLDKVPRDLPAAAGAQPGLLEMALQMPAAVGRGKRLIELRGGADTQGAIIQGANMTTVQAMLVGATLAWGPTVLVFIYILRDMRNTRGLD